MRLRLLHNSNTVIWKKQRSVLQRKTFLVLQHLVQRAPKAVSRQELILKVWQGNHWTGEKGLNHAIWTIRSVLGDNPKDPRLIETIPRYGYRWLHKSSNIFRWGVYAAALTLSLVALYGAVHQQTSELPRGLNAYLANNQVFVDLAGGCRRIIKTTNLIQLGQPILSEDGYSVAVPAMDTEGCRLLTLDLHSGEKTRFDQCPIT
ncbi:MAG: winged helix-turn-helix domain-containing protein [Pseudomonadota bacterium]